MSRWYPIAAAAEECKDSLAGLYFTISNSTKPSESLISRASHCFERLQLWCFNFDVDSHELDKKLRKSPSLSEMVLDLLDDLQLAGKDAEKKMRRRPFTTDSDVEAAMQSLLRATRITDLLFGLSGALLNPAFSSEGQQSNDAIPVLASIRNLPEESFEDDARGYPTSEWRTAIILNATKTCLGSRWEEVGALLTHLLRALSDQKKRISFVRLSSSLHSGQTCELREAIELVRSHQPQDELLDAAEFGSLFSATLSDLVQPGGSSIRHKSLIFVVPDGIMATNLVKIERAILQHSKLIREVQINQSSMIVSFVVIEPNRLVLESLFKIALAVNNDRVILGTTLVRIIPFYMLSASENTYDNILCGGVADLDVVRRTTTDSVYMEHSRALHSSFHSGMNKNSTIEVFPISHYTSQKVLSLEFGRFGPIRSVSIKYGTEYSSNDHTSVSLTSQRRTSMEVVRPPSLDLELEDLNLDVSNESSTEERTTRHGSHSQFSSRGDNRSSRRFDHVTPVASPPIDSVVRCAIILYEKSEDAAFACNRMDESLFDGETIHVNMAHLRAPQSTMIAPSPIEISMPEQLDTRSGNDYIR